MGWVQKIFKSGRPNRGPAPDFGPLPPKDKPKSRRALSTGESMSYAELAEVLGPPPLGAPGTSVSPAGGVYGESNPGSRAAAQADADRFAEVTGRQPTKEEMARIEQRHLGWGYE